MAWKSVVGGGWSSSRSGRGRGTIARASAQALKQHGGAFCGQVFLHELEQAVALHQGAEHFGLGFVECDIPLGQDFVESGVVPGLSLGAVVATGRFRADMVVSIENDGPVTLLLEL